MSQFTNNANDDYIEPEEVRASHCIAIHLNRCSNDIKVYPIVYHYCPDTKDISRRYIPYKTIVDVPICNYHHKKLISVNVYNGILPEIYGYDLADAQHTLTCVLLPEEEEKLEDLNICVCDTFGNNKLHKALLTYTLGFYFGNAHYYCGHCNRNTPDRRDQDDANIASLVSVESVEEMVRESPQLVLERNFKGKTPLQNIPEFIESLEVTLEYARYTSPYQHGKARVNIANLVYIQKKIIEIMEEYAN